MNSRINTVAAFLLIPFFMAGCGSGSDAGGGTQEVEKISTVEPEEITPKAAAIPKAVCVGENVSTGNGCFTGMTLNSGYPYQWQYVTGSNYSGSNAYYTTYSSGVSDAATWNFTVPVSGDVWFSAYIPGANATTSNAWYFYKCQQPNSMNFNGLGVTKDQLAITGWTTLGNLGYFASGSWCSVTVRKLDNNVTRKLGVDAVKLTIY